MINRQKYPFSHVPPNPLWTSPSSSVPGCRKKCHCFAVCNMGSAFDGAQLCLGSSGKMLCNCAIPCQDSLVFSCGFQAKFLQFHDQFWASNVKLKWKNRVSSSSQLGKLKYLCSGMYASCFICCGYLTLGGSCARQGVKSKEKAVFSCARCPYSYCTCEQFPLTSLL